MRLVAFQDHRGSRLGVEVDELVVDLDSAFRSAFGSGGPTDLLALIDGGPVLLAACQQAVDRSVQSPRRDRARLEADGVLLDLASIRPLAPLRPRAILCSGSNYWDHRGEKPPVPEDDPEFFLKLPDLVTDPGDPVALDPKVTSKLDHETELAIVIGREGRHISAAKARQHVFGYTIMNDVTARDQQIRRNPGGYYEYFLGPGKNFDTAAPMGPVVVTADEIPDPQGLRLRSFVNGKPRQKANTADMIWGVDALVQFFSKFVTLRPGFVISSGTPGRTAWGWDPEVGGKRTRDRPEPLYLRPGDVVRVEIEKIGALENPIVAAHQ